VPADECQARLNARLRAWAAEREGVHVFGLRAAAASMRDGGVLEVRGNRYDPERKRGLIQADLLHPTLQGTTALVLLVLDELARLELLDPQRVEWDAARLERRAWDATAETREAKQARRREREARRAKREEQEAPAPSGG